MCVRTLEAVASLYTRPPVIQAVPAQIELKKFWQGSNALPTELPEFQVAGTPVVLIKKGGDYPAFWQKSSSFIAVMENFYVRMRKINQKVI